jgi:hypothetical protein
MFLRDSSRLPAQARWLCHWLQPGAWWFGWASRWFASRYASSARTAWAVSSQLPPGKVPTKTG